MIAMQKTLFLVGLLFREGGGGIIDKFPVCERQKGRLGVGKQEGDIKPCITVHLNTKHL